MMETVLLIWLKCTFLKHFYEKREKSKYCSNSNIIGYCTIYCIVENYNFNNCIVNLKKWQYNNNIIFPSLDEKGKDLTIEKSEDISLLLRYRERLCASRI